MWWSLCSAAVSQRNLFPNTLSMFFTGGLQALFITTHTEVDVQSLFKLMGRPYQCSQKTKYEVLSFYDSNSLFVSCRIRKMSEKLLHFTHLRKKTHTNRKTPADSYYKEVPNISPVEPESRIEVLIFTYKEHL